MTRILVISAGLSQPSSTRLLADRLASATQSAVGDELVFETVEVRDYAHDITDHLLTGFANKRLRPVLEKVADADGLVLVTPTFTASYSGLFKSLLDVVELDSLRDKPVLIGATGGTERHSLMLEHALRPVLAYLKAVVMPTAVYAANGDWGSDADLDERITQAAAEFAAEIARANTGSLGSVPRSGSFRGTTRQYRVVIPTGPQLGGGNVARAQVRIARTPECPNR